MMRITERSLRSRLSRSSSKLQMWKRSCSAPPSLTRESQKLRGNGSVLEPTFQFVPIARKPGAEVVPQPKFCGIMDTLCGGGKAKQAAAEVHTDQICLCVGGDRLMCHEDSISEDGSSSGATSTGSPKKRRCF
jgi:hypothetical protein